MNSAPSSKLAVGRTFGGEGETRRAVVWACFGILTTLGCKSPRDEIRELQAASALEIGESRSIDLRHVEMHVVDYRYGIGLAQLREMPQQVLERMTLVEIPLEPLLLPVSGRSYGWDEHEREVCDEHEIVLRVTLADLVSDSSTTREHSRAWGKPPGLVSRVTAARVIDEGEFAVELEFEGNVLPFQGIDLEDASLAKVDAIASQIQSQLDPSNDDWLVIRGIRERPVIDLRLAVSTAEPNDAPWSCAESTALCEGMVVWEREAVRLGLDGEELATRLREVLSREPSGLLAVAMEPFGTTNGEADVYYVHTTGNDAGDWLFFVADADILANERRTPGRTYARPGFFADPQLARKVSNMRNVGGDRVHEKIRLQSDAPPVYASDEKGRVFAIEQGLKRGQARISLSITRVY